jgi:hypothetical protein
MAADGYAVPAAAEAFLREQGRMKYVRPLFREMLRSAQGRPVALALFAAHGDAYHAVCAKMVAADIAAELAAPAVDPRTLQQLGETEGEEEEEEEGEGEGVDGGEHGEEEEALHGLRNRGR